jgi:hypothetical protein
MTDRNRSIGVKKFAVLEDKVGHEHTSATNGISQYGLTIIKSVYKMLEMSRVNMCYIDNLAESKKV